MAFLPKPTDGSSIVNRAITDTLYVSPDGDDSNGSNWNKAYTTIQGALDAASTDANDCTLIMIAPHPTYYDIDTAGDPTWAANVEIKGTHRLWAAIRNTHASATSIFKFTGKASIQDIAIFQTGTVDGVIFTKSGWRVRTCGFNSELITGAATSVVIDGSAAFIRGGIMEHVQIRGAKAYSKGLQMHTAKINEFIDVNFHDCLTAIQIEHADSDSNYFTDIEIGNCTLGVDIDAGNGQHFRQMYFHSNTRNIDDEVGDHFWVDISGNFSIKIYPDDFTGITVPSAAGAGTWGTLTELVATGAIDNPFRIVGIHLQPAVSQNSRLRLTADAGTTYHDDIFFDGNRREGTAAPSGTEFIFNADTKIEASAKVVGNGPDNIVTWIEIQEI